MPRLANILLFLDVLLLSTSVVSAAKVRTQDYLAENENFAPSSRRELRAMGKTGLQARIDLLTEEIAELKTEIATMKNKNTATLEAVKGSVESKTDKMPELPPLRNEGDRELKTNISRTEARTRQINQAILGNIKVGVLARTKLDDISAEAAACKCKNPLSSEFFSSIQFPREDESDEPEDSEGVHNPFTQEKIAKMEHDMLVGLAASAHGEEGHLQQSSDAGFEADDDAVAIEGLVRKVEELERIRLKLEVNQEIEIEAFSRAQKRMRAKDKRATADLYAKRIEVARAQELDEKRARFLTRQRDYAVLLLAEQETKLERLQTHLKEYTTRIEEVQKYIKDCYCREDRKIEQWIPPEVTTTAIPSTTTEETTTTTTSSAMGTTSTTTVEQISTSTLIFQVAIQGFVEFDGKDCVGAEDDILVDFEGTVEECKAKCKDTNCSGFVFNRPSPMAVAMGWASGKPKCTLRAGLLSGVYDEDSVANIDCYAAVEFLPPKPTTTSVPPGTTIYKSWEVDMEKEVLGPASFSVYEAAGDVSSPQTLCNTYTSHAFDDDSLPVRNMRCYPGAYWGVRMQTSDDKPDGPNYVHDMAALPPAGGSIVFRFTVPVDGAYTLDLFGATRIMGTGGKVDVKMFLNDQENVTMIDVGNDTLPTNTDGANTIRNLGDLVTGDFLYFVVTDGGDGATDDLTAIRFRIIGVSAPPPTQITTSSTTTSPPEDICKVKCRSVCAAAPTAVRVIPEDSQCETMRCKWRCEDYGCGFRCGARECASGCKGDLCGYRCHGEKCSEGCEGDTCGTKCTSDECASECVGDSCGLECNGKECANTCEGNACAHKCKGENCGKGCKGYRCAYECEGDGCAEGCVGNECGLGCQGKECAKKCEGLHCANSCNGEDCGEDANEYLDITTTTTSTQNLEELAKDCSCDCTADDNLPGFAYVTALSLKNDAYSTCDQNGATLGTLDQSATFCSADNNCESLFDFDCDGTGWRHCTSSAKELANEVGAGTEGCSKSKQSGWIRNGVEQVGTMFVRQKYQTGASAVNIVRLNVDTITVRAGETQTNKRVGLTYSSNDGSVFEFGRYIKLVPGGMLVLPSGNTYVHTDNDLITLSLESGEVKVYLNHQQPPLGSWATATGGSTLAGKQMLAKIFLYEKDASLEVIEACKNIEGSYSTVPGAQTFSITQTGCIVRWGDDVTTGFVSGKDVIVPGEPPLTVASSGSIVLSDGTVHLAKA
eukprot:TRINITY_DN36735_c0_g1_i1.p1 TRINITY_DN36735_c0_g1~~TRINITY_DN36735_c0_g1_i1.p1  ORF type:complete len:1225 (-),score=189.81 TRINITY_DN36735_c0_g1_i1:88-3762(-)